MPDGPTHGVRPDGRVDVTAKDAWPDRPPKAPLLTSGEVAEGCAILAACLDYSLVSEAGLWDERYWRFLVQNFCLSGAVQPLAVNAAERVIPLTGPIAAAESWDFMLRSALEAQGDCSRVKAAFTERDPVIGCQEDGCFSTEERTVTCAGDVASYKETGRTRDCSRSGMRCSTKSPTGCTDRPLVLCTSGGKDRCDGEIKLGCDDCGFVSFHDCSWNGGHCEETPGGAQCVPPGDSSTCAQCSHCNGSKLSLCVSGTQAEVDCNSVGMTCSDISTKEAPFLTCDDGGILNVWTHAFCRPLGTGGRSAGDASTDAGENAAIDGAAESGGRSSRGDAARD
jgi:hypothetical protein